MKKIFSLLVLISSIVYANEFYAKLNPVHTYNVKSAVSGKIVYINDDIKANIANNSTVIKIDSKIDEEDLRQSQNKIKNLQEILKIEEGTLKSFKKVSSKSKFDKDNQKIKILNIISSINDLKTKIATLKDMISKKTLIVKNDYIYDIAVEVGDYVTPGVLLYSSADLSAGKLEIFIPIDSAKEIKNKTIYLDGKKTDLKISKLYKMADLVHISSYKCEIIVPSTNNFSTLVKIEFK